MNKETGEKLIEYTKVPIQEGQSPTRARKTGVKKGPMPRPMEHSSSSFPSTHNPITMGFEDFSRSWNDLLLGNDFEEFQKDLDMEALKRVGRRVK